MLNEAERSKIPSRHAGLSPGFLAPVVRRGRDKALREQSLLCTSGDVYLNSEAFPSSVRWADGERDGERGGKGKGNVSGRQVLQDRHGAPLVRGQG